MKIEPRHKKTYLRGFQPGSGTSRATTEDGQRLEISDLGSRVVV